MLKNCQIRRFDVRSPGRRYPYYEYEIQCLYGGCTWSHRGKGIREVENEFFDHDIDWHDRYGFQ